MLGLYGKTVNLSSYAMMVYSCILQIWRTVLRICRFMVEPHHQPESSGSSPDWEVNLPVTQFKKVQLSDEEEEEEEEEEVCSICLVEFEEEESVNKLPKCGHLFHADCLDRWLDRCQFTCPLCRSSLLMQTQLPSKSSSPPPPFCIDHLILPHHHHHTSTN